jgi:hypothetical protein
VAAQAEGLEPELAHTAQAGRRATAELCQAFWEYAAADGLLADRADPAPLALLTNTLICADTVVHLVSSMPVSNAHDTAWVPALETNQHRT